MAWTTPRTWVTGELVTAALLNTHLKDNLNAIVPNGPDAWTSYTPTLTQSATVTKTVTRAAYMKVGRLVVVSFNLSVTGTGTASNAVLIGLPLAAVNASDNIVGNGLLYDSSAGLAYVGSIVLASTTTIAMYGPATSPVGYLGTQQFTAGLASSDRITGTVMYEAAS